MQTTDLPFLQFLRNFLHLILPIYQRRYRWTAQHCERLVDDAFRAGADPEIRSHYVGMITTMSPHHSSGPWYSPLTIVDGQPAACPAGQLRCRPFRAALCMCPCCHATMPTCIRAHSEDSLPAFEEQTKLSCWVLCLRTPGHEDAGWSGRRGVRAGCLRVI